MSHALLLLRQNDPQETSVTIDLNDENDDAVISQALEQNQYISRVRLRLTQRNTDWDHLYRVLAARRNLVHFVLFDHPSGLLRAPAARIRPILQAIQQNASVRSFVLADNFVSPEDLCSFLDATVHVTDLTLNHCDLTGGAHGARDIAAALQRNTSIVSLKLLSINDLLDSILEGLVANTCVRNVIIGCGVLLEAIGNALQGLLESTRSIQHLELFGTSLGEESFRVVAHGLINRSSVTGITLNQCYIQDEGSIRLLNQIFVRKQNLHTLAIKTCFFGTQTQQFYQALFSALRRADSPLRHFQSDDRYSRLSDQSFSTFCQAVAVSKLDSFSVGMIESEQHFTALTDAIPSMKIRELHIQFGGYNDLDHRRKQTLREAFKDNYSLQSVKYRFGDDDNDPFDSSVDDDKLKFYLERNIRLAQWVENPATVPKQLWKEATTLATKAGPETLFRLLRKIAPEVLPVRGRKRKRTG